MKDLIKLIIKGWALKILWFVEKLFGVYIIKKEKYHSELHKKWLKGIEIERNYQAKK